MRGRRRTRKSRDQNEKSRNKRWHDGSGVCQSNMTFYSTITQDRSWVSPRPRKDDVQLRLSASVRYFFFFFKAASGILSAQLSDSGTRAGLIYEPSFDFFFGAPFPLAFNLQGMSDRAVSHHRQGQCSRFNVLQPVLLFFINHVHSVLGEGPRQSPNDVGSRRIV